MAKQVEFVKNQRAYIATIGTKTGATVTVQTPFTCDFDITRGTFNSMNHLVLRLYNLNKATRDSIYWDETLYSNRPKIEFKAGYGIPNRTVYPWDLSALRLATCFKGTITKAYSVREGTNYITTIEAYDGGDAFMSASIGASLTSGTISKKAAIEGAIATMAPYGVTQGAISPSFVQDVFGNPIILPVGGAIGQNSMEYIKTQAGGVKIDNGVCHCIADNDCIPGAISLITSDSGLLGTPRREGTFLDIEMIFEPRLSVFQQIFLDSFTGSEIVNGVYKVMGFSHKGMISETVCGQVITSVRLFFGTANLNLGYWSRNNTWVSTPTPVVTQ